MRTQDTRSNVAGRRAELMAELFLQELDPEFISKPTCVDVGYDLLVGFKNTKGGINTFAVEVKATERPPTGRFQIVRRTYERFAHSNVPGLLLVADVKQSRLHYAWLNARNMPRTVNVSVPLVALDEDAKATLHAKVRAIEGVISVAG